jgi:hypothetical protein
LTERVIPLRPSPSPSPSPTPSRPPSPSRPGSSLPVPPVRVEWDGVRGLYIAACGRCCETFTTDRLDQAHEWAETHTCDPELADLLADITHIRSRAA